MLIGIPPTSFKISLLHNSARVEFELEISLWVPRRENENGQDGPRDDQDTWTWIDIDQEERGIGERVDTGNDSAIDGEVSMKRIQAIYLFF